MMCPARLLTVTVIIGIVAGLVGGCAVPPIEELSRKVESPQVSTREQAIVGLANLLDGQAIKLLAKTLASDKELCAQAAVALVKHGRQVEITERENPVVAQVSEVLKNTHLGEQFRARAAWALGEIGDRRAIALLKEVASGSLADERKPIMKQQAAEALAKLGFDSEGRAFELPMGSLASKLEIIPDISPLQPPA